MSLKRPPRILQNTPNYTNASCGSNNGSSWLPSCTIRVTRTAVKAEAALKGRKSPGLFFILSLIFNISHLMNQKVVLAYSGGLDTTYCAIYLQKIKGLEIHALTVNTGGFSDQEIEQIATRAKSLGVASFQCVDVTKEYYDSCIKYLIYGNILKNATYPLS